MKIICTSCSCYFLPKTKKICYYSFPLEFEWSTVVENTECAVPAVWPCNPQDFQSAIFSIWAHLLPWICYAIVSLFYKYVPSTSVLWLWTLGADLARAWPLWPLFFSLSGPSSRETENNSSWGSLKYVLSPTYFAVLRRNLSALMLGKSVVLPASALYLLCFLQSTEFFSLQ